jgi:hypothetical protein
MSRAFIKTYACILSLLLMLMLASARGQIPQARGTEAIHAIEFAPGRTTAVVTGSVQLPHGEGDMHNDGADRYTLSYRAGQTVSFNLQSEGQRAVFSISKENHESLNFPAVTKWTGKLPESGKYLINIFTNVGTANYTFKITRKQGAGRKR